ncbi:MAG: hypothetical protein KJ964_08605 [Verrucomicrobia bacterium]|nr:hypothetical protein [Verrucomicrobiota bacterium]MBU1733764.1 hypothetical protein [Verrucomicrobiota bacterium]MBU1856108.1 hypothetical protein [Verrucomicrobiota bacterium]
MKLIHQFTGCGAVMLAIVLSGWAAEQAGGQKSEVRDQQNPTANAPVMFATPGKTTGGPVNTGGPVITGGTNAAGRPSPFSAEIGADFMRKVMETSAKIEEAKRQIAERQAQLYATNPEIKSTRARMIAGQKEINRILDADQDLAELKMSRDILWSTMPVLPKGQNPALMPRMPVAR